MASRLSPHSITLSGRADRHRYRIKNNLPVSAGSCETSRCVRGRTEGEEPAARSEDQEKGLNRPFGTLKVGPPSRPIGAIAS